MIYNRCDIFMKHLHRWQHLIKLFIGNTACMVGTDCQNNSPGTRCITNWSFILLLLPVLYQMGESRKGQASDIIFFMKIGVFIYCEGRDIDYRRVGDWSLSVVGKRDTDPPSHLRTTEGLLYVWHRDRCYDSCSEWPGRHCWIQSCPWNICDCFVRYLI